MRWAVTGYHGNKYTLMKLSDIVAYLLYLIFNLTYDIA